MALEAIRDYVEADMRAVDGVIRARLHSSVPLIRQVAEYIVGGGGKRFEPDVFDRICPSSSINRPTST